MARAQDINLDNESQWEGFIDYWQKADYTNALAVLSNTSLDDKYVGADVLNFITDWLVTLQNTNDPSFKADLIKVSDTPPTDLATDEIYFKIIT